MSEKSNSRRSFLKKSAAALVGATVFPSIIPASAMGKNGFVAPSNRIEMALVGSGGMGRGNMKNALRNKAVELVALCDVDKKQIERSQKLIIESRGKSEAREYEDFRQLLDNEKLDAAILALPDHWHSIIACNVANKGIHIYGEKPLARTISEGRAIVDSVNANNIIWQTGSWQRSIKNFRTAVNLVRNGVIGEVTHVEVGLPDGRKPIGTPAIQSPPEGVNWDMWLGPAPKVPFRGVMHFNWRWIMDYSGGQLTDWAGHHVDIAHWGLGYDNKSPIEVEGKGVYPIEGIYNVPVEYDFTCKYDTGVNMRVANASAYSNRKGKGTDVKNKRGGMGTVWYGEKGWIHVDRSGLWASCQDILDTPESLIKEPVYFSGNHMENFIDCVKSGKETITPAHVAHNSISVGLLGEIAMLTNQKLLWDGNTERFTNSEQANRLLSRPFRSPWQLPQ
ncbi:Gfo/Idh/MocA family protein [Saccharicrinis aurantiacus]|uniref:Gfo/Idh/MocA family protein n=1 Tax=Saccharicrinis aurantiacus TaxID=1849719 RepID=UPI0024925E0B|nr:Gfo/Idh/MocA family oxidoreductase [Saccharicrinis aurantiacus]